MYFLLRLINIWALLVLFNFLIVCTTYAQMPTIEWQKTIGGNDQDQLESIQQTIDGGYILGGWSRSDISGDKTEDSHGPYDSLRPLHDRWDYWVVKLDGFGNIIWDKTIGGDLTDHLYTVQQTSDGGYILGGFSNSDISGEKTEANIGSGDYWVVKIDGSGNIEWQNTIGGNLYDQLNAVQQTNDGGYILGGNSLSGISGDKSEARKGTILRDDYWVVKLDGSGNITWDKTIGSIYFDWLRSLQQTSDGGYILGGSRNYDYWVVKIDGLGNTIWQKQFGGDMNDHLYSVRQTSDGGYILGGHSAGGVSSDKSEANQGLLNSFDYWVIKLDGSGNAIWEKTIGGNQEDFLYDTKQTSDGGYILAGTSNSERSGDKTESNKGRSYWVVKLDGSGNIIWDKTIGGGYDELKSVWQTSDGGYILGGSRSDDYWILKLTPDSILHIPDQLIVLPAYPNPFNSSTTIRYGLPENSSVIVSIYDVAGRMVKTLVNRKQLAGYQAVLWNGTDEKEQFVSSGIYFFHIQTGELFKTKKIVLLK